MNRIPRPLVYHALAVFAVVLILSIFLFDSLHIYLVNKLTANEEVFRVFTTSPGLLMRTKIYTVVSFALIPFIAFGISMIHFRNRDSVKLVFEYYAILIVLSLACFAAALFKMSLMKWSADYQIVPGVISQFSEDQVHFYDWAIYAEVLTSGVCAIVVWMKRA